MKNILAFISGSIFGLGLTISSMTNPESKNIKKILQPFDIN